MQVKNVPLVGPRYWTALTLASVFGANLGDFVSRVLHLGHASGLPPLAMVFALILMSERRAATRSQAYYWAAIVTVRAAATNLADLATHDLKLAYPGIIAGLAVLLISILALAGHSPVQERADEGALQLNGLPSTNKLYWAAMLAAGTLGTAAGDFVAGELELGLGKGSVVLSAIAAITFYLRSRSTLAPRPSYWFTVVAVRAVGTTVGDYLARRGGLPVSTTCTGLLLVLALLLWRDDRDMSRAYQAPTGSV